MGPSLAILVMLDRHYKQSLFYCSTVIVTAFEDFQTLTRAKQT